ncbi:MAG TPA: DNA gyrase inhibitor YacG [Rubrivivax sp.]|nr:DNA gyrase inhibitor YacG [Burkholderiales bacterium]HNU12294.1 DNA gyrase inhibitor YacG [Rubrivivax sp.]
MARKPIVVPCPSCRQPSRYGPENPWRPFCSERCRSLDLGAWASESYRVPAISPPDGPADDNESDPPRH